MSFEQVFLHVGPPKTGTSSIQHTLARSRACLSAEYSIEYPLTSDRNSQNYPLVAMFKNEPLNFEYFRTHHFPSEAAALAALRETRTELETRIAESRCATLVLSAEGLWFLRKPGVLNCRDWLAARGSSIKVVCYLRNLGAWLSSIAQERVKNGTLRKDLYVTHLKHPFRKILTAWIKFFGRQNLIVRHFEAHRHALIADFATIIGVSDPSKLTHVYRNESLSGPATELLLAINERVPRYVDGHLNPARAKQGVLMDTMRRITGQKYRLPQSVLEAQRDAHRDDLEWVRKEFSIDLEAGEPQAPLEQDILFDAKETFVGELGAIINEQLVQIADAQTRAPPPRPLEDLRRLLSRQGIAEWVRGRG